MKSIISKIKLYFHIRREKKRTRKMMNMRLQALYRDAIKRDRKIKEEKYNLKT